MEQRSSTVPLTVLDLLQNSILVLIRFCQYQHAFSADIGGKFLQVGVIPQDQPSIRLFAAGRPSEEAAVHQNVRHMYGAKDLPTCAQTEHNCQRIHFAGSRSLREKRFLHGRLHRVESH